MRAAEFATRVAQARHRGDHYVARCPAHEDRSPSLSFRDGQRGLLLHCWAGCRVEEIASAVELTVADLFYGCAEREGTDRRRKPVDEGSPEHEWRRIWTGTLRDAESNGRYLAIWGPIFSRADFVRHARRLAEACRARATGMRCDDPAMWDEAGLAMLVEDEARLVEHEADCLTAAARLGSA